jgi:hypothetical protein
MVDRKHGIMYFSEILLKRLHTFEALMQDGSEGHPASEEELHFVSASSGHL